MPSISFPYFFRGFLLSRFSRGTQGGCVRTVAAAVRTVNAGSARVFVVVLLLDGVFDCLGIPLLLRVGGIGTLGPVRQLPHVRDVHPFLPTLPITCVTGCRKVLSPWGLGEELPTGFFCVVWVLCVLFRTCVPAV